MSAKESKQYTMDSIVDVVKSQARNQGVWTNPLLDSLKFKFVDDT